MPDFDFHVDDFLPCDGLLFHSPRVDALPEDTWTDFSSKIFPKDQIKIIERKKRGRPRMNPIRTAESLSVVKKVSPSQRRRRVSNMLRARAFRHRRREEEEKFNIRLQKLADQNQNLLIQKKDLEKSLEKLKLKARMMFKIF